MPPNAKPISAIHSTGDSAAPAMPEPLGDDRDERAGGEAAARHAVGEPGRAGRHAERPRR